MHCKSAEDVSKMSKNISLDQSLSRFNALYVCIYNMIIKYMCIYNTYSQACTIQIIIDTFKMFWHS